MPRVRSTASLKIVYGAMPPNVTPEYKEIERYTTHLVRRRERRERQPTRLHILIADKFCFPRVGRGSRWFQLMIHSQS